ncbi:MAG: hypothetical protein ACK559_28395, partial [bacterium]
VRMLSLLCEKGIIQNLYMDLPAYYEIYHDQFYHSVIFSDFLEKNSSHGSQGVGGSRGKEVCFSISERL